MTPKQRPKEERINQIIDVALDCFTRNGYVNTTIDDIAEGCQLSKGSIYWYFKTKDDILIQTIQLFTRQFDEELSSLLATERSQLNKISDGINLFLDFHEQNTGMFNLFVEFWAQSKNRDEVKTYWNKMLNTFKDGIMTMVETGIQTKEFESVEIEPFVWGLMATLDGLAAYASFVDDLDLRKIMQVYGDVLLRGLGANQDLLENKA
jgi:AcrR family transcriptional regulator